jgi:hypothetical protein
MATKDDTSTPRRSPRKAPQNDAAPTAAPDSPPPVTPPRTLEEALINVRKLMLEIRGVLHCLSEVLLYADDGDSVMHAEVAQAVRDWAAEAAAELDLAKLKPLIDAIRERSDKSSGEGGSAPSTPEVYQVREPTPVYRAA